MLKILKRDWWKLVIILLLLTGLDILNYQVIVKYGGQFYSTISTRIILMLITFAVAALGYLIDNVLPTFIHERKTFWKLAWKYIALRILLEIFYFIATSSNSVETAHTVLAWIKWPYFLLTISLLLGFLCAAANEMGLWMGIKNLFTRHLKIWFCVIVSYKLIKWLCFPLFVKFVSSSYIVMYISSIFNTILVIAIIYICLPLFKKQNQ